MQARTFNHSTTSKRGPGGSAVFGGLVAFAVAIALTGGSSRYDVPQLILLQPVALLALGFGVFFVRWGDLKPYKGVFWLLVALTALIAAQLIPLPHQLWSSLPGHGMAARADAAVGFDGMRPLSLAPGRTYNALFNMAVPLAGIVLFAALRQRAVPVVLGAILVMAAANALLGLAQIGAGGRNIFYLFRLTAFGAPVGLFANPNHAAVFNAIAMVVIVAVVTRIPRRGGRRWAFVLWPLYALLMLVSLVSPSRTGLLGVIAALLATGIVFGLRYIAGRRNATTGRSYRGFILGAVVSGLVALFALFFALGRVPALERFTGDSAVNDLRFRIAGTLIEMIRTYFPFGSGIGSFEQVYYIAETPAMLMPSYVNNAHNDWLQLVIEGGLPALLLLLVGIAIVLLPILRLLREGGRGVEIGVIGAFGILIVAFASGVDYPLRTPLFQLVAVWLVAMLIASSNRSGRSINNRRGGDYGRSPMASAVSSARKD